MDWEINKVVLEVIRESDGLSIQLQIHFPQPFLYGSGKTNGFLKPEVSKNQSSMEFLEFGHKIREVWGKPTGFWKSMDTIFRGFKNWKNLDKKVNKYHGSPERVVPGQPGKEKKGITPATILFYFSTKYNFYSTISISTIFYFYKKH